MCKIQEVSSLTRKSVMEVLLLARRAKSCGAFALANAATSVLIADGLRSNFSSSVKFSWVIPTGQTHVLDACYLDLLAVDVVGSSAGSAVLIPATQLLGNVAGLIARTHGEMTLRDPAHRESSTSASSDDVRRMWGELFAVVERDHVRAACRSVLAGFRPARDTEVAAQLREILA